MDSAANIRNTHSFQLFQHYFIEVVKTQLECNSTIICGICFSLGMKANYIINFIVDCLRVCRHRFFPPFAEQKRLQSYLQTSSKAFLGITSSNSTLKKNVDDARCCHCVSLCVWCIFVDLFVVVVAGFSDH